MFDNPEKLFILFVIALMILGPSKLASLGSSLGRSIRDFRSAVRGAHDEFRTAVQEHVETLAPALPAPDVMQDSPVPAPVDYGAAAAPEPGAVTAEPVTATAAHDAAAAEDDPSSLASEPTTAELKKTGAY